MRLERVKFFAAIGMIMFTNIVSMFSRYYAKETRTGSPDITFLKGLLHLPFFSGLIWLKHFLRNREKREDNSNEDLNFIPSTINGKIGCLVNAVVGALPSFALFAAVLNAPVGDVAAVTAATPCVSYAFTCIILKQTPRPTKALKLVKNF